MSKFTVFWFATLLLTNCSSLKQKISGVADMVDKPEVAKIRTIAIVGLTVDMQKANNMGNMADTLMGKEDNGAMGKMVELKESKLADEIYTLTVSNLMNKGNNWKVTKDTDVIKNALIKNYYEKKNATVQMGVTPLKGGSDRFEKAGIPQIYYVKLATKEEMIKLAQSLKVDAIAFVNASTILNQKSIMGLGVGKITTEADVHLSVFSALKGDYVMNYNQRGAEIDTKDTKFMGFMSNEATEIQALSSIDDAEGKLIEKMTNNL
jgi:hypothetical protein